MIREMFDGMPIVSIIIAIIILGITFVVIDERVSKPEIFYGYVVDKQYKAENNTTGTGYGMTSSGKSGVIITTSHEDEKFLLIVKTESGKVVTVECKPEVYYRKEIGQKILCNTHKGYFTGWVWSLHVVR